MVQRARWFMVLGLVIGGFLAGIAPQAHAAQAGGPLSGTVVDSSGGAVVGADVALLTPGEAGVTARTLTDAGGTFSFPDRPRGAFVVEIGKAGFATARVAVAADQVEPLQRVVLSVAGVAESVDVVVTSDAAYASRSSSAATRTSSDIDTVPQSIVTVPRAMIDDQGSRTLSDALRNVSNVAAIDERDANNVGFRIRGFHSATVVDGVAMPGYFTGIENLVDIERIDVVKGPAGALFGSGQGGGSQATLGGTIAITTAAPTNTATRQVAARLGSYGERGVSLDVNQPLGATVSARMVADVSSTDSETDGVFFHRVGLFPSLAWRSRSGTSAVVRMRWLDASTLDYSGLPTFGTLDTSTMTLPRNTGIAATGQPDTTTDSRGVNVQVSHALSARWTLGLTAASTRSTVDQRGSWLVDATSPFGCFDYGTVQALFNVLCGARLWDRFHTTTVSPALTGVIAAGSSRHTISVGLDHERTTDDAFFSYSNLFGPVSFSTVGLANPVYPAWSEPLEPATPDQQNRYVATVAYAQEQFDRGALHMLAGLRFSSIDVTDQNPIFLIDNTSTNRKMTPRVGAVVDLSPKASVFVGFNSGMKVPTGSIFSTPPKPEESSQVEVGVRTRALAGLTATVAWFDLTRRNVAIADIAHPGFAVQAGEQRSRGVDADVRWQPYAGWTFVGALTRQNPEIVQAASALLEGTQLFNVPKVSARIAGRYDVRTGRLTGFGAGVGVTYHSELPGNSLNAFFTPSASVWDGQVSYARRRIRVGLNGSNLADRQYFVPSNYFGGNQVIPARRRTLVATVRVSM